MAPDVPKERSKAGKIGQLSMGLIESFVIQEAV
jgi:hypothetical protein